MTRFGSRAVAAVVLLTLTALAGAGDNRLVHEGIVEAPRAAVWKAFTTKEGLEKWMVAHAEIDLKIGGKMRTHYNRKGQLGDPGTIENTILSYEPGRMLSIKATKAPAGFPFTNALQKMWTVIYFEDAPEGKTRVRVVGLGFGDDEESQKLRGHFQLGNGITLKRLQKHFADKGK